MNAPSANRHPKARAVVSLLGLLVVATLLFLLVISFRIVGEASREEVRPVDAIVVFGAAEYAGRPSPVFRARLDHAFDLFGRKIAPVVITTGGSGYDPDFSEGGVGHDYLMHRGIPEGSLIAETQGSDTAQSAERVAVIMRTNRMHTCVAVSDEYHMFRIKKLLDHEGVEVYVAPRTGSRPRAWWQRVIAVLRESFSYLLWKLHLSG
jgi:uncharacterized SAM-binding protein YcdF (DUF218 family)